MVNCDKPLWMPKGSIRAIIALAIVGSSICGLLLGKLNVDEFLSVTAIIVAFYFTSRGKK
jgi:hypothetical protein